MNRWWQNIGMLLSILMGLEVFAGGAQAPPKSAESRSAEGLPSGSAEAVQRYVQEARFSPAPYHSVLEPLEENSAGAPSLSSEDMKSLRETAEQGEADSQFRFGLAYLTGGPVPKSFVEAVKWLRKAADQNYASAELVLGVMYAEGKGVRKDPAEAVKLYRRAAEQHYRTAQYFLGVMLANGIGEPRDTKEAAKWIRKSAERGDSVAQRTLGWMYEHGESVPADAAQARQCRLKAAGDPEGNDRERRTLRGHTAWGVTGVAFSPDGKRLATCDSDTKLKVWDWAAGQDLFTSTNHGDGSWSVAYSPDGRWILSAGAGGRLWDANTGRLIQSYPPQVSMDWLESGPLRQPGNGHGSRIEVVGFSADGKRALTGGNDGKVLFWDVVTGASLLTLELKGNSPIHAAAFSPDGLTIATGNYAGLISFWDGRSGQELSTYKGHTNAIESLAYFPDSSRIVSRRGSADLGHKISSRSPEFPRT